jgi:predicted glycosyltransferase
LETAKKLEALGNVLLLRRYSDKGEYVDSARIVANADLVVSAGGTMAREAALQGVPSIITSKLGKTQVNRYLARKGFPIFMGDSSKVLELAKKHLGNKVDVSAKLAQFDNPVDIIEKVVAQIKSASKA